MADVVRVFPRGPQRGTKGTWWPTVDDAGKHYAIVTCPVCAKQRTIGERIDTRGNISPPYWCDPGEGCSFKETIRLAGWIP